MLPRGPTNLAITSPDRTDFGRRFAGRAPGTIPVLIVYIAQQKHRAKRITAGAPKG
jgi:ABC-type glycerol-3-phosphate transport system permease component